MTARWKEGVWLGKCHLIAQHVPWDLSDKCVVRSRNIKATDEALSPTSFDEITVLPDNEVANVRLRDARPRVPAEEHQQEAADVPDDQVGTPRSGAPRRWQVTREVFNRMGATPNCAKCTDWAHDVRSSRNHTEACIVRMEQGLQGNPVFAPRILSSPTRRLEHDNAVQSRMEVEADPAVELQDVDMESLVESEHEQLIGCLLQMSQNTEEQEFIEYVWNRENSGF